MPTFKPVCPNCRTSHRQTKAGLAVNGNQRYQCQDCKRYYVRENRRFRYSAELRARAVELYTDGVPVRQIARTLGVNHQTAANWVSSAGIKKKSPGTIAAIRSPTSATRLSR